MVTFWSNAQTNLSALDVDYKANNKSIINIIEDLENKYNLNFAYASESFEHIKLDVDYKETSLEQVLNDLTSNNQLEYKIYDDVIMLRKSTNYRELVSSQNYKESYHLKGRVVQSSTSTPMEFASISVANSTIGTYTDKYGKFDIEIPAKYASSNLIVQYLGYDEQQYKITESENTFLLIPLKVNAYSISEITIVNREAKIKVGGIDQEMVINNNQLQNSTSGLAGSDLARNLQLLPGINATDDASADIKIRGSNSDETLLILDGIPVYNASHYYGIFSSINSNYLESINLYKNAFPIQYGGKTAGVVEMFSKEHEGKDLNILADINLLTASANIGFPIADNSSLFLSARSSLGNISNTKFNSFTSKRDDILDIQNFADNTLSAQTDPKFKFHDINAKYSWVPNDNTKLSLNLYSSNDDFSLDSQFSSERRKGEDVSLTTNTIENWNNLGASALLNTKISNDVALEGRLFYSEYFNEGFTDINIKNTRARNQEIIIKAEQKNNVIDKGLNIKISKPIGVSKLSLGLDAIQHQVNYRFQENEKINIEGDDQVSELTPFGAIDIGITDKLNLNVGARSTYYEGTESLYFSPRLAINYAASENVTFKGSFSKNQQFLRELNYEYRGQLYQLWVNADQDEVPIIESTNFMLGGTARIGNILLDVEAFNKDMTGMIEYAVLNPTGEFDDDPRPGQPQLNLLGSNYELFTGNGRSKGIDVLLSTNLNNYNGYMSYTLSKTEHSFQQIQKGSYFASEDDRTHQLKWINEYHFGDFTFGVNYIFSTGRLYTNLNAFANNEDIRDIPGNKRTKRLPSYQRLDLSAAYKLKFGNHNATFGLSIFNALNHQNVKYEQLIESRPQDDQRPLNTVVGTTTNLLNRTLNLSFKIDLN